MNCKMKKYDFANLGEYVYCELLYGLIRFFPILGVCDILSQIIV